MTEDWGEPVDFDALWEKESGLKRPIEAAYASAIAPVRRRRDEDRARIEREYAEKISSAKSKLSRAHQEFKETIWTLKRWKDASIRAIDHEYETERRPHSEERKTKLAPIQKWRHEQWERIAAKNREGSE